MANRPETVTPSMPEVHGSVSTSHPSIFKRMFAFLGPAYLVSVGYMDPGNWATDLEGGARFGYQLLWVLVMSNIMAILLQTLSARLGIVAGRDLAQACRDSYPKPVSWALWILCEIAIAACDLAEVLGAAIGLNLLFGLPLIAGVFLTAADTLLVLWFTRFGIRVMESIILALVTIIGVCFLIEIFLAKPDMAAVATGLIPRLNDQSLYVAIGILGATVMPHNLYLHSSLVQTRRIGSDVNSKRAACRFNLIDSVVALNGALLVNAAILILAGAVFFTQGIEVNQIQQAHQLLAPLLGTTLASAAFAVALLCSGQSSTITGTMAGQIVMEGFLNFRMRPWLRRLITRAIAVIPAAITIAIAGDQGTYRLLIFSQVVLSLQLPFAVIPLIHFTSDRSRMGSFANPGWVRAFAWTTAAIIVALNLRLATTTIGDWLTSAGRYQLPLAIVVIPVGLGILGLLIWVTAEPVLRAKGWIRPRLPQAPASVLELPVSKSFDRIMVPLDHSPADLQAISHAMAASSTAKLFLVHVEEDVTSQLYGDQAQTAETEFGRAYFESLLKQVHSQGRDAELLIRHGRDPIREIAAAAKEVKPDLIVMGAHGHKGLQDLIFGTTINEVRHRVGAPILIVPEQSGTAGAPRTSAVS